MRQVKKVEIIISSLEINEVSEILDKVQVSGYTIIKNASGKGERGTTYNDLDREFSNSYFMTVCTNEQQLEQLVKMITPLLKKVGGVCLVTEANWLIH
jgi:nitrogen regulatory protein PII